MLEISIPNWFNENPEYDELKELLDSLNEIEEKTNLIRIGYKENDLRKEITVEYYIENETIYVINEKDIPSDKLNDAIYFILDAYEMSHR